MTAESAPTDKLIGEILANRYQILERLGEGAMGVVYKARHVKVGRPFAVKVLHTRLLEDPKVAVRFAREAELAGRLRHANVVGVVDVGELDGTRYMVMDFAEGPDLAQLLGEAPMPPARVIHLVRQILEGLFHAHEQGLIHRDLKPENVIIERDNHRAELPRLVDFGIAILREGSSDDSHGRLTTNGLVLGTPHYMAPEQAVADPIDHRIDLFALGIMIYEMLSGQLPFDGSGAEVARANLLLDPPPISQRVAYLEVDPLLEAFSRRLMAKKPNDRPATAKAARELLDLIDRDRPAAAAALGLPPSTAGRQPAMTQPVTVSQVLPAGRALGDVFAAAAAAASAPETRRLRATPTPNSPLPMAGVQADPAFVPNAMTPPPFAAMPAAMPAMPMAYSGSGRVGEPNTAVQAPLPWPDGQAKRRLGIIGGIAGAVIAAGIVVAVLISGKSSAPADRVAADTLAIAPVPAAGAAAPAAAAPVVPAPSTEPAAAAIQPPTEHEMPPEPVAVAVPARPAPRAPSASSTTGPVTRPSAAWSSHPARPEDKANAAAIAAAITSSDPSKSGAAAASKPAEPAVAQPVPVARPAPAKPDPPAAPVKTTGLTAAEINKLYFSAGNAMRGLPSDQAEDLQARYRNYDVNRLMLGSQADRDKAAVGLRQILQDAQQRKASSAKAP